MNLAHSSFADAYRAHVVPRLRVRIAELAHHGYDGELSFSDMICDLHTIARHHGAGYLPAGHYEVLDDWITRTLLDACEAAQREIDEADAWVKATLAACHTRQELRAAVEAQCAR